MTLVTGAVVLAGQRYGLSSKRSTPVSRPNNTVQYKPVLGFVITANEHIPPLDAAEFLTEFLAKLRPNLVDQFFAIHVRTTGASIIHPVPRYYVLAITLLVRCAECGSERVISQQQERVGTDATDD